MNEAKETINCNEIECCECPLRIIKIKAETPGKYGPRYLSVECACADDVDINEAKESAIK